MSIISIENLDMVFGACPKKSLQLLDQGWDREAIRAKTGLIVGVHKANLSIEAGEIFVLMGLSGSGKSTLLRALNGLLPITRGEVRISIPHGLCYDLSIATATTWRTLRTKHMAMVFQKFALFPWKNILDNVAFGLELSGLKKEERLKRAYTCLEAVGLSDWTKQYPYELSGGMQQRVGLARALATDADILLMDEPFSALDPLIKNQMQQELLKLQKSFKKSIVFVTHDLDEALKLGNHIAIMQEGKIVQIGSPDAIITCPKNSYVRQFVAQVDQMQLLRAKSIMTALHALKVNEDLSISLDEAGHFRCNLDADGRPRRSLCHTRPGRMVPWTFFQSGSFLENDLILGHEQLLMRDIIKALGQTKRPLVIQDQAGKMVGAITPDTVLSALSHE